MRNDLISSVSHFRGDDNCNINKAIAIPIETKINSDGYTLIEILVVIVLISIITTFAVLNVGDFGAHRRLKSYVESFTSLIHTLQNQALLESSTFRIRLTPTHYEVSQFSPPDKWSLLKGSLYTAQQNYPTGVRIHFIKRQDSPDIIVNANGEVSSFQIQFSQGNQDNITLSTDDKNEVSLPDENSRPPEQSKESRS